MRPAFKSIKHAAAFALLLIFLLAAPWLGHKTFQPGREHTYSSESIRWERFPWMQKFIFDETNDIDIAFVGSSRMGHGIDTPYVQQALDERLGRKTVVRSICFLGSGFDALYFFTKKLLEHRRVRTLVFYDECSGVTPAEIAGSAKYWLRFGDDNGVLSGLPAREKAIYYFATVLGMPRNLLEWLSPNLPRDTNATPISYTGMQAAAADPEFTMGCIQTRTWAVPGETNFGRYTPTTKITPAGVLVYSPTTATNFAFSKTPMPVFQAYFAKQFGLLARQHGCKLVLLHLPVVAESASTVMKESSYWPDLMQTEVSMLGVPSAQLYAGLSRFDIYRLYVDPVHFNENGQKYFTPLITPELLQIYESHSTH